MMRVLLVLSWCKQYPNIGKLEEQFKVDESTISREVKYLLPILVANLRYVKFPDNPEFDDFFFTAGSVDGTPHLKNRTHPKCYDWFRADKGAMFINSQITTGHLAHIYDFVFCKGHNNDQGLFNMSWLKNFLIYNQYFLLADGGYHHSLLITPNKQKGKAYNSKQKQRRSLVEIVIGYIKHWGVAREKFRGAPELHEMALWVVYQIAARKLEKYPIRV